MAHSNTRSAREFYQRVDRETVYAPDERCDQHPLYSLLNSFIRRWNLQSKKCLEIGSSKGLFQDLVDDYTGVDVVEHLRPHYHKSYVVVSDARLPFPDGSFDGIFTYATHEHIPDLEVALNELIRVLKPGGVCLFAPAWHTRSWFAEGLAIRPFADLNWTQRFAKASIPFRDAAVVRWPIVGCRRVLHLLQDVAHGDAQTSLRYGRLRANYETFWHSDSDACNSLDPFDLIVWFKRRGVSCLGYERVTRALLVRAVALELRKADAGSAAADL